MMEYKRFTKFIKGVPAIRTYTGSYMTPFDSDVYDAIKCLAELEDKIEQGTLKEIPCNIGDTLYTNWRWCGDYMRKKNAPYPVTVVFIGINDCIDMGGGIINIANEKGRMWQIEFSDIGETFFLTREEAEAKLKELQE